MTTEHTAADDARRDAEEFDAAASKVIAAMQASGARTFAELIAARNTATAEKGKK